MSVCVYTHICIAVLGDSLDSSLMNIYTCERHWKHILPYDWNRKTTQNLLNSDFKQFYY